MLRRFLFLSAGALALMVVLGGPGQLHAQGFRRGGFPMAQPSFPFRPGFPGGFRPVFPGRFGTPFGPGPRRIFGRRFDRFEDRFENRFNRGFFDPRFSRGLFDPRFSLGFSPGFSSGFSPGFFPPF